MTLTYPHQYPEDPEACKNHLKAFRKRLESSTPEASRSSTEVCLSSLPLFRVLPRRGVLRILSVKNVKGTYASGPKTLIHDGV